MTLRDVYHYATQHYDRHRRQLTLAATTTAGGESSATQGRRP